MKFELVEDRNYPAIALYDDIEINKTLDIELPKKIAKTICGANKKASIKKSS